MSIRKMVQSAMESLDMYYETESEDTVTDPIQDLITQGISAEIMGDPDFQEFVAPVVNAVKDGKPFDNIKEAIVLAHEAYYRKYPVKYTIFLIGEDGKKMDAHLWPGRRRITEPPKFRIEIENHRYPDLTEFNTLSVYDMEKERPSVGYHWHIPFGDPMGTIDFSDAILGCEDYKIVRARYLSARSTKKLLKSEQSRPTAE